MSKWSDSSIQAPNNGNKAPQVKISQSTQNTVDKWTNKKSTTTIDNGLRKPNV